MRPATLCQAVGAGRITREAFPRQPRLHRRLVMRGAGTVVWRQELETANVFRLLSSAVWRVRVRGRGRGHGRHGTMIEQAALLTQVQGGGAVDLLKLLKRQAVSRPLDLGMACQH